MTVKEAILIILEKEKKALTYTEIYKKIIQTKLYDFGNAKTPKDTVSAQLTSFIQLNDLRVKRVKENKKGFVYFLTEFESDIDINVTSEDEKDKKIKKQTRTYQERDLHILLSTFLTSQGIKSKTIFHEKSNGNDNHQKWIHPDMVGIRFLNLKNKNSNALQRITNQSDTYNITSYELKREINTDYDFKKKLFSSCFKFKLGKLWIPCCI